jgi:UDP-glucose 4-epimerase
VVRSLVTGGAGFIGSHLVEGLLQRGDQVRILDDFSSGSDANLAPLSGKVELVRGSITSLDVVESAISGCDNVYHLAALPSVVKSVENPLASHASCATGTLNVLEAARKARVKRVVYASSSAVYGDQPGESRRESDPLLPLSPYAAAKLGGEHYASAFHAVYGLETVRLRFFNVFGPRQDAKNPYSGVIALFIGAMLQGRRPTIFGDGLQSRDFVYVGNVVQALMLAALAPLAAGKVYNVGMGSSINLLQLVAHINNILGGAIEPIHQPARAGDIRMSQSDIAAARSDLGYEPRVSFAEGLALTLQSFR